MTGELSLFSSTKPRFLGLDRTFGPNPVLSALVCEVENGLEGITLHSLGSALVSASWSLCLGNFLSSASLPVLEQYP